MAGLKGLLCALPDTLEQIDKGLEKGETHWIVTVFDNDKNTWDEVVAVLIIATGCTEQEAFHETWEVHHLGRSVVHHSDEEECRRVAGIIARIGIRVEVSTE